MTKKGNSILFIVVGTIVNVIILLSLLFAFIVLDAVIFKNNNDNGAAIFFIVGIFASLFLGMFIYQKLATWVIVHFNLEDKLDPLFVKRTMKKSRYEDGL